MKKVLLLMSIAFILSSCTSYSYYQVRKITTIPNPQIQEVSNGVFEDNNCKITYNFWIESGEAGFLFYNKTNKNIYLNLGECFYLYNNIAYNYYQNRTWDFRGYTQKEEQIVCIPPLKAKTIIEYNIDTNLYYDCDLVLFPNKKQIKTLYFTQETSPLIFGNIISYSVGKKDSIIKLENLFYVSEITNYPREEMIGTKHESVCKNDYPIMSEYFKIYFPNGFYIKYYMKREPF